MKTDEPRLDLLARERWKELECPIKPMRGFVVIVREDPQIYTRFILSNTGKKGQRALLAEARVLAVGLAIRHSSGEWIDPQVKRGDRVLTQGYTQFCVHKVLPNDDIEYEVIQFGQIAAILDEPPEVLIPDITDLEEREAELDAAVDAKPRLHALVDADGEAVVGAK